MGKERWTGSEENWVLTLSLSAVLPPSSLLLKGDVPPSPLNGASKGRQSDNPEGSPNL